jgi:hypothetical protein
VRGWVEDTDSDNYLVRYRCLSHVNLDIIGLAETHLRGKTELDIDNYRWIGQNRTALHINARRGSGGVACLVHKRLLQYFSISKLDDSEEGILWVRLASVKHDIGINICVCYLPPEGTSRYVNPQEFYDTLLSQVFNYQNHGGVTYLMGDFNGRCGSLLDYIEGVDDVPERSVVDTHDNAYGELLCDFLGRSSFCMLNGRNVMKNDYTYRDISVVDYCLMPHEQLSQFESFEVKRAIDLFVEADCVGLVDDPARVIPDHNLLMWKLDVSEYIVPVSTQYTTLPPKTWTKYDLTTIPQDFLMTPDIVAEIDACIDRLQSQQQDQNHLNEIYTSFCEFLETEMKNKVESRTVKTGLSNKRRRVRKPFWNTHLDELWNIYAEAEKEVNRAHGRRKQCLVAIARCHRKNLDREVQACKRRYWRQMQEQLLQMQTDSPKEYWKYVGNIGVGGKRNKAIPWEVKRPDGTMECDPVKVIGHWKDTFESLLNPEDGDDLQPEPEPPPPEPPPIDTGLDEEISVDEVRGALHRAKLGKALGYDQIPVEVLKNESAIKFLHRLFNVCFNTGRVPDMWARGVINPIPKCNTSDPRDPTSYRGITLASSMCKLYAGVLNRRLNVWSDVNGKVNDEQNGFRTARSCGDHLSTLTQIIETRKKKNQSTFVSFIDFSKAYDRIKRPLLWYKLKQMGINAKFLTAVQSLYENVKCCLKLNGIE